MGRTVFLSTICILICVAFGQTPCSGNANLMKSIQYQLKLVEDSNSGHCDCGNRDREHVVFSVQNSKPLTNVPSKSVVIYDKVITNAGNGYDPSSGIFSAPSDGYYIFSWTILTQPGKNFYTYLDLNGNLVARNHAAADNTSNHVSSTQTVALEIKKNDKVSIKIQDGQTGQYMYNNDWSTFNGYKI